MREAQQDLWVRALDALRSEASLRFLASLGLELTLLGRCEYGPDGTMPPGSEVGLRCVNELLHRSSMQMCLAVGAPHGGYPDEAFLSMLQDEAKRGERLGRLEVAVSRALQSLDSPLPTPDP